MIDLYFFPSPNGLKVAIMLEECGLPYRIVPVNILRGEQFAPGYLRISPNNKIPAIVDCDAGDGELPVFESGAVLKYLAEKTGRFLPGEPRVRYDVLQWLFWQVGGLGPMAGQAHHFRSFAPEHLPYAIGRYTDEVNRLYGVLDRRLARARVHGGRILDRRHGVLSMGRAARVAGADTRGLSGACGAGSRRAVIDRPCAVPTSSATCAMADAEALALSLRADGGRVAESSGGQTKEHAP